MSDRPFFAPEHIQNFSTTHNAAEYGLSFVQRYRNRQAAARNVRIERRNRRAHGVPQPGDSVTGLFADWLRPIPMTEQTPIPRRVGFGVDYARIERELMRSLRVPRDMLLLDVEGASYASAKQVDQAARDSLDAMRYALHAFPEAVKDAQPKTVILDSVTRQRPRGR